MKLWEGYVCREHVTNGIIGEDRAHFFWTREEADAAGFSNGVYVREVVEITDEDIWRGMDTSIEVFNIENPIAAFEAGALWMKAKMEGKDE